MEYPRDPERTSNPYEAPRAELGPPGPRASRPVDAWKRYAVTHDLTDAELKRFVNFDVYYDPKPLLGFVPQWVCVVLVTAVMGAAFGRGIQSDRVILVAGRLVQPNGVIPGGLLLPAVVLGLLNAAAAGRRRQARRLGLCKDRTVTVSPAGLSVTIPGARPTALNMNGVGPMALSWGEVRKITASRDDLIFWLSLTLADSTGRRRLVVPLRAFPGAAEAEAFEDAARYWHEVAGHAGPPSWDESDR